MPELFDRTFDETVSSIAGLVLIYCYSEGCAPCQTLEPVLAKLKADFSSQVTFFKLNIEKNPDLMGRFSLFSVPTLLFTHNGKPVAEIIGAFPEKTIRLKMESLLEGVHEV